MRLGDWLIGAAMFGGAAAAIGIPLWLEVRAWRKVELKWEEYRRRLR